MDPLLYQIASDLCNRAYDENIDLGTTEYLSTIVSYQNMALQVLAIPGTNELKDWLKNLNPLSSNGIKSSAVESAELLHRKMNRVKKIPLLVTGHSKGGAAAIAYKKLFDADYCIAFCPARSLRYNTDRKMENTTIFIDRDDPVPFLGFIGFGHPICERHYLPKDFIGFRVQEHLMRNVRNFIKEKYFTVYS